MVHNTILCIVPSFHFIQCGNIFPSYYLKCYNISQNLANKMSTCNIKSLYTINCHTKYLDCDKIAYFSCYRQKVDCTAHIHLYFVPYRFRTVTKLCIKIIKIFPRVLYCLPLHFAWHLLSNKNISII